MKKVIVLLSAAVTLLIGCKQSPEHKYRDVLFLDWKEVFHDDFSSVDTASWHLDGLQGRLEIASDGLVLSAGNTVKSNSDHVVLWNKMYFKGDIRVEYDFTRLDTCNVESVNIIYLLATGSEKDGFDKDILKWNDRRRIPAMETYFNHMNLYHISYAVEKGTTLDSDYVRGRRYIPETGNGLSGTALTPEYTDTGMFKVGVKYHLTVIKKDDLLFMNVSGDRDEKLFWFDLKTQPAVNEGYVGLRQMWGRVSKYDDFKIFTLSE